MNSDPKIAIARALAAVNLALRAYQWNDDLEEVRSLLTRALAAEERATLMTLAAGRMNNASQS